MTRIMVYAANPVMRVGLESIIRTESDFELAGSSSKLAALLQLLEERQPEVLLMESEAIAEPLLQLDGASRPAIVVLTDNIQSDQVVEALLIGVQAFLPSSATTEEILATVRAVATGLVVLHPDLVEPTLKLNLSTPMLPGELVEPLTLREQDVLQMLALGLSNKVIASRLNISEHTVKFHLSSIFSKLNASSRTEAVTLGLRQGLILL